VQILLDQNLSPKLIRKLTDLFPGLESVYNLGLTNAPDTSIFTWAKERQIDASISSDRDFIQLAEQIGPPPKVIRIEQCGFPSSVIEQLLRREAIRIYDFLQSSRTVLQLRL
jgi:predicted nuclease of predicted toxin-antitoxin system